jgi:hypothetical protein
MAYETVFNQQLNGEIDNKTADSRNTTLKGISFLKYQVPLKAMSLYLTARLKKIPLPMPNGPLSTVFNKLIVSEDDKAAEK